MSKGIRSAADIARSVNTKAKTVASIVLPMVKNTPGEERYDLLCAFIGVLFEMSILEGTEDEMEEMKRNIGSIVDAFTHVLELRKHDPSGRLKFCLGCPSDGKCLPQAIVKDWEENESVPELSKS